MPKKESLSTLQNVLSRVYMFKDWYKLMFPFNRMFTGVQKLTLQNRKSAYVRDIHSIDMATVQHILWDDEYALEKLSLPKRAVVFDLGANIGTFCIGIRHICPTAHITAYEPHPDNFKMLALNAPFATLIQKAATKKTGIVHLEDSNKDFVQLQVVPQGGIPVESISLNDMLKNVPNVDLLKIDIEGSEYGLLNAASPETLAKVQRIIMELHIVPDFDEIAWAESFFKKQGFTTSWVTPNVVIYGEKM